MGSCCKKITILMPCKDQKKEFLRDAIESVLNQTSPNWILLIVIQSDTPDTLKEFINSYSDSRIKIIESDRDCLAGNCNLGMKYANTDFVCELLTDDKLDKRAVTMLKRYIKKYPDIDFFYSSRRYIDARGKHRGKIIRSIKSFDLDYFKKFGSPVKHLLCWRRKKGLAIGGMDEKVSLHGCDDYDFPWMMAEAGCKFKSIKECLYHYRIHHDFYRLTTHVPKKTQISILKKIFRKHKVSEAETQDYISRASRGYLIIDKLLGFEREKVIKLLYSYLR